MDDQGEKGEESAPEELGVSVNPGVDAEESAELPTEEHSRVTQERVPTKIVRATKALESGRKIRILEKSLSETLVYEPDYVGTKRRFTNINLIRMIVGLGITVFLLGGILVWNQGRANDGATSLELEVAPIVMPARPVSRSLEQTTKQEQSTNNRPALRPVRMLKGLSGIRSQVNPVTPKAKKRNRKRQKVPGDIQKRQRSSARASSKKTEGQKVTQEPDVEAQSETPESEGETESFGILELKGPPNTAIQIDQAKIGNLPLPELGLPPGLHSIWAELPGHEVSLVQVTIVEGQSTTVAIKMTPIPAAKIDK